MKKGGGDNTLNSHSMGTSSATKSSQAALIKRALTLPKKKLKKSNKINGRLIGIEIDNTVIE